MKKVLILSSVFALFMLQSCMFTTCTCTATYTDSTPPETVTIPSIGGLCEVLEETAQSNLAGNEENIATFECVEEGL